jgi:hypothetical protein
MACVHWKVARSSDQPEISRLRSRRLEAWCSSSMERNSLSWSVYSRNGLLTRLLKLENHQGFREETAAPAPCLFHHEESGYGILSSVELADEHGVCRGPPPCFGEKEGEVEGIDGGRQRIMGHLCAKGGASSQWAAHNHFSKRAPRAIGSLWVREILSQRHANAVTRIESTVDRDSGWWTR